MFSFIVCHHEKITSLDVIAFSFWVAERRTEIPYSDNLQNVREEHPQYD